MHDSDVQMQQILTVC